MVALVVLTGCLARAPLKKESFSFSVPSPTNASASAFEKGIIQFFGSFANERKRLGK
jgi:hypothetical protein